MNKNKIILSLLITLISGAGITAMNNEHHQMLWLRRQETFENRASEDRTDLDKELIKTLIRGDYPQSMALVSDGANPNMVCPWGDSAFGGDSALMLCCNSPKHVQFLIDAGADIYYKPSRSLNSTQPTALMRSGNDRSGRVTPIILKAVTKLNQAEKDSVKNWLLLSKKLFTEQNISIPRDMRRLIAEHIMKSLAEDLLKRVVRAGGRRTLSFNNAINQLIQKHLEINFLKRKVKEQIAESFK